jgi:molecular chaperone GrpE
LSVNRIYYVNKLVKYIKKCQNDHQNSIGRIIDAIKVYNKIFKVMSEESIGNLEETKNDEINEQMGEEINEATNTGSDLSILKNELEVAKDKYLRLFAEFDNYKKRTSKERIELLGSAAKETLVSFLSIADDFERAKKVSDAGAEGEVFSNGVNLVYNKFFNILESKGLKEMESTGDIFDSEKHEAITEIPAPNPDLVGKIVDTVEKGYYLNEKIIRYAKVVVGK